MGDEKTEQAQPVSREEFQRFRVELTESWLHTGLDVSALTRCLLEAGIITPEQLRLAREALKRDAQFEIDRRRRPLEDPPH